MGAFARGQSLVWLYMAYVGFGLGVCYDLLTPLRRGRLTPLADLLFFAASACAMGAGLVLLEQSAPRAYVLLGAAFGGAVYALGVRAVVIRVARAIRQNKSKKSR